MTNSNYGLFGKNKEKESTQLARVVFRQIMRNISKDESDENSYLKDVMNIIFKQKNIDEMTGVDIKENIQRIIFIKQLVSDNDEFDLIPTIIQVMNDVVHKIGESKPSNSQFPRLAKTISFISPNITNMLHKLKKLESGRFEKLLKICNFIDEDKNINKLIHDFKAPDRMKIILNALYCCIFTVGVHFALDLLLNGKELDDQKDKNINKQVVNYKYNWESYNYENDNDDDGNINNDKDNNDENGFVNREKRKINSYDYDDNNSSNTVFSSMLNKNKKRREGITEKENDEEDKDYNAQTTMEYNVTDKQEDITTKSKEEQMLKRKIQDENVENDNHNEDDGGIYSPSNNNNNDDNENDRNKNQLNMSTYCLEKDTTNGENLISREILNDGIEPMIAMNEKNKTDPEKEKKIQPSVTNEDQMIEEGDFLEKGELTKCNEPHEKRMKKSSKRKKNSYKKYDRKNKLKRKNHLLERVRSDPELYRANEKIILMRKRTKSIDF